MGACRLILRVSDDKAVRHGVDRLYEVLVHTQKMEIFKLE
jgi:hypothetical protein